MHNKFVVEVRLISSPIPHRPKLVLWVIFSTSASEKNDENLVIVRGDQRLAQICAVHVQIVYDHYSWRAFLAEDGDPCTLYASLSGWETGSTARDLAFWMLDPVG